MTDKPSSARSTTAPTRRWHVHSMRQTSHRCRRKYRLRVGNALDAKVTKYKRGPRKSYASPVKRSDVYDPSKFVSYKRKRKGAT